MICEGGKNNKEEIINFTNSDCELKKPYRKRRHIMKDLSNIKRNLNKSYVINRSLYKRSQIHLKFV